MPIPVLVLVGIPIFLGIVYVAPFDQPEEEKEVIAEKPDASILYFMMMGIWIFFLLRIILLIKRGTFKISQRY